MLKKYQEFGEGGKGEFWKNKEIGRGGFWGFIFLYNIKSFFEELKNCIDGEFWEVCSKVMSHHQGPCLFILKCGCIVLM